MNNHWLLEWPLANVDLLCKKVRQFIKLSDKQNPSRVHKLRTSPWVKHISPIIDLYYPAEEVDPTDEEIDKFEEQDPSIIFSWKKREREAFSSIYVSMIENVFEEPPGYYVYADEAHRILVFSNGTKRVGCLAPK